MGKVGNTYKCLDKFSRDIEHQKKKKTNENKWKEDKWEKETL